MGKRRLLWAALAVAGLVLAAYGVVVVSDVLSPDTVCDWAVRRSSCP
ncbi:hypothetical protein LJ754_02835 [Arthrobacter sp. zg-Y40]|nr:MULTISPECIES: hypothetical protein [unclassified Arthrobacter]MCC3278094.1 hypothetical protein [Arthrobacter sp. zg-Y40]MDK1326809.1 hypothetical protein [Arthrobacter sp. zg-Y1143]